LDRPASIQVDCTSRLQHADDVYFAIRVNLNLIRTA
jgi:hypothetical protein